MSYYEIKWYRIKERMYDSDGRDSGWCSMWPEYPLKAEVRKGRQIFQVRKGFGSEDHAWFFTDTGYEVWEEMAQALEAAFRAHTWNERPKENEIWTEKRRA